MSRLASVARWLDRPSWSNAFMIYVAICLWFPAQTLALAAVYIATFAVLRIGAFVIADLPSQDKDAA